MTEQVKEAEQLCARESCRRPIVGRRKDAKYCSNTCGSAMREARTAARYPEYAERRKQRSLENLRGLWKHKQGLYNDGSPTNAAIKKFGLPEGWNYFKDLEKQDGGCAICGKTEGRNGTGRRLAIDHDHRTGKYRGLLCDGCNAALGVFGDNEVGVERALAYLRRTK